MVSLDKTQIRDFRAAVYDHYACHGRHLPWRETADPYEILVSEFMLQQTQVSRVHTKYSEFLRRFPTVDALADASFAAVLEIWQGLGYNRRALALHKTAVRIKEENGGRIPSALEKLTAFPGIGHTTASALLAFAFGEPTVFVETNIRTVFLFHFFDGKDRVDDKEILPLVATTLDRKDPRTWYYALMDYGVTLKARVGNLNRRSRSYRSQSRFEGSDRQLRGKVLRILIREQSTTEQAVSREIEADLPRLTRIIQSLVKDGLVRRESDVICLR